MAIVAVLLSCTQSIMAQRYQFNCTLYTLPLKQQLLSCSHLALF